MANRSRWTGSLLLVLFALCALIGPALPTHAQSSPVTASWSIVDSSGVVVQSPIQGKHYAARLTVNPTNPNDHIKWSLAGNVNVTCLYSPIFGVADQLTAYHDFDIQVRHDADPAHECTIAGAVVNYSAAPPQGPIDGSINVPDFTFSVLPKAIVRVATATETVIGGFARPFVVTITSLDGPQEFSNVDAHLDCGAVLSDDYHIAVDPTPTTATIGNFAAALPKVFQNQLCTWTGTFDAGGEKFPMMSTQFIVSPDPTDWQLTLLCPSFGLIGKSITCTARVQPLVELPDSYDFAGGIVLNDGLVQQIELSTVVSVTLEPLVAGDNFVHLMAASQLRSNPTGWETIAHMRTKISGVKSQYYLPFINQNLAALCAPPGTPGPIVCLR